MALAEKSQIIGSQSHGTYVTNFVLGTFRIWDYLLILIWNGVLLSGSVL
jgi:hypothetical protein